MRVLYGVAVVCLALLMIIGVSPPANAQHCENGVCQLGAPVVAVPGPYFGGPVVFQPAPVIVSPGYCRGPNCSTPFSQGEIVYACNGSPCHPAPVHLVSHCPPPHCSPPSHCRPVTHDWRTQHNAHRGGSIGISLNWNRSGSCRGSGFSRCH